MTRAVDRSEIAGAVGGEPTALGLRVAAAAAEAITSRPRCQDRPAGKGPSDFAVSRDGQLAHCLLAIPPPRSGAPRPASAKLWTAQLCGACPLRGSAAPGKERKD